MYRLVRMKYEVNSIDEAIRLGLCFLLAHLFTSAKCTIHTLFRDLFRYRIQSVSPKEIYMLSLAHWLEHFSQPG